MKIYICNAFSLSMLNREQQSVFFNKGGIIDGKLVYPRYPVPKTLDEIKTILFIMEEQEAEIISAIGHESTAKVMSNILERELPPNRISVKLDDPADKVIVAQVMNKDGGPYRLPEGATQLPDDATLEWWIV